MKKLAQIFFLLGVLFCGLQTFSQRTIAITIDDPNTTETPRLSWQARNRAILHTLQRHHLQAALFVCGKRVDSPAGTELLQAWDQAGHLLCNHSYSHGYYPSASVSGSSFIADYRKGDAVIRDYQHYTKLFRFPYLKEGDTPAKRDSMRLALRADGYRNGYVTIDASDWYVDAELTKALKADSAADLTPYKEFYIHHILDRANYYDGLAQQLFHRNIHHTLLIHHSLLNALFLDDLLTALEANGWKLIPAEEAYRDKIFRKQPRILPCGESIVWQCAKLNPQLAKTLRFPAEDSEYEELPLLKFLEEYKHRNHKGG